MSAPTDQVTENSFFDESARRTRNDQPASSLEYSLVVSSSFKKKFGQSKGIGSAHSTPSVYNTLKTAGAPVLVPFVAEVAYDKQSEGIS